MNSTKSAIFRIMIDLNDFDQFEKIIKDQFQGVYEKRFNQLEDWSSMQILIVISSIDEHYDTLLTHEEIKSVGNLDDLHELVRAKK